MRLKTLRVIPNPWLLIHVYADGVPRPVNTVQTDRVEHVAGRFVGAKVADAKQTVEPIVMRVGFKSVTKRTAQHDVYWEFTTEPVEIPNTGYYRDQIRDRALIPCDAETAKAGGLREFRDPLEVLAAAKAAAIADYDASYGEGAFEAEQPEPAKAEQPKTEPAPAEQPADVTRRASSAGASRSGKQ